MAFFSRNFNDASFSPLFRLLDDFDHYSRQGSSRTSIPDWEPKFDIRETEQTYELHGEFPGIKKEDVHIEFTQPQTMLIRGKTERTYTSGTPPAGLVEGASVNSAITEGGEDNASHKATVEDELEAVSHETEKAPQDTSNTEVQKTEQQPVQSKPADKAKYWLTERSVGEFSRTFSFPNRVDQDSVTASFENGILNITVPKAKKHESRRVAVN